VIEKNPCAQFQIGAPGGREHTPGSASAAQQQIVQAVRSCAQDVVPGAETPHIGIDRAVRFCSGIKTAHSIASANKTDSEIV
jgi:hypothetical protein